MTNRRTLRWLMMIILAAGGAGPRAVVGTGLAAGCVVTSSSDRPIAWSTRPSATWACQIRRVPARAAKA